MADNVAGFFGKSTEGADLASQLDTLSGWMTANVPRMQGPQSDKDVAQYKIMAAAVGDRSKPISQRLSAANELKGLQNKYAEINGGTPNAGAAKQVQAPIPMKGMVRSGYKFKGGNPADKDNWEQQ